MSDLFDLRDMRPAGRPETERRSAGRRREDLLVEIALLVLPGDLLDAERACMAAEGSTGLEIGDRRGMARGLAHALERLTGEPADEIRARARALVLEELTAGRTAAATCRLMLEGESVR